MQSFPLNGGDNLEWLKDIRIRQNLTQCQVSKMSNISLCFYCQIEKQQRTPSVITAKKIAKTLGFDWTKFFEKKEKEG